ncbi:DMT family transporter [Polaromonas sp. CG_9.11]|uniref:DMT family transporter n=1 Tax=Polaromonas sp. CG_9.11 TaxID=2787730 RepID=UPI0018CAF66E|nr:DMT family transporter [Polaromonas sp. CG_9.11]MBG6078094.1 drug/metabolite transporter (DMT)-like permease [Polaromonas sp. CG_9.11]
MQAKAQTQSRTQTIQLPSTANFSIYPLMAVLIWTGNTLVTKAAAVVIDPAAITFYRWLLAGMVLSSFLLRSVWRQRAIVATHWPKLAFLGLLGMGMYQGLAYQAAKSTSAINMGVVVALMPLMSALLASFFAGERLTASRMGGAVLSLLGLLFLSTQGHPTELLHGAAHWGDALMLIAVASNALYGVLLKRWALPLTTWQQLYVQIGFGILVILPFWWFAPSSPVTAQNIPLILYAGIPASIGAPFFWMSGIKQLGPVRASLFMNLLPIFVAVAASTLLGEQLHTYHAVGGLLALAGVWWGQRQAKVTG